jgi:hypothetical protein
MRHRLRPLAAPFLVGAPAGVRVRTRLAVSEQDALVLWELGRCLGRLAGGDLAVRCARGRAGGDGRGERKRALTGRTSSRWAGAITRTSNDQWEQGCRNLRDDAAGLQQAVQAIGTRLAIAVARRALPRVG